jgi:predicted nucleic acid-binding protein
MDIIIDTDVLSTFGKIRKHELLLKLFPLSNLLISPTVYQDLIIAKERGYDFVEYLLSYKPKVCQLNQDESEELMVLKEKEKSLGCGEIESIILAKSRGLILLTNDKKALRTASRLKVDYFNLPMLLRQFWRQDVLSKREVIKIINVIEEKDRIVILNKGQIFED